MNLDTTHAKHIAHLQGQLEGRNRLAAFAGVAGLVLGIFAGAYGDASPTTKGSRPGRTKPGPPDAGRHDE